ncbi:MAG: Asp23/Gls24 family envelope stress response protein [Tissierellales bacterium]|jgi:uncharacterized alkaline shock family protein YloU|nr:Asp23/Gls24 family envelope stress response protein [Tissierellales bacterium]
MKEMLLQNYGHHEIFISDVVIANIIVETLNQYSNVNYVGGKKGVNQFLKRNKTNIEKLDETKQLKVDVRIQVPFGVNIPELTRDIQKNIIDNFVLFLDLENVKIDLIVDGFIKS